VKVSKPEFDRRGISIAVVSFAEPSKLVSYQERHQWPFAMLADPERRAYQAFDLKRLSWFRVFSPATLMLYIKLLRDGMKRGPYAGDDIYQSGGDFLINREGRLLYAHRSQDPADRPTAQSLLRAIDSRVLAP